ncbi:MAG: TAXI family TRAP transporter solute-binding subunit, partial [Hyphomicrobiaceae bacterium]
ADRHLHGQSVRRLFRVRQALCRAAEAHWHHGRGRASRGSGENVALLKEPNSDVSVALLQGGITNGKSTPQIVSLGRVFIEPLWVFYRGNQTIDRLHQLRGQRIAVGPPGSGTRHLAITLLSANRITAETTTLQPESGKAAIEALRSGRTDAIFLVLAPDAPMLKELLADRSLRLMNFAQAEAYTRLFPYLQRIVLPQGAIDLVANIPERDITLVAPVAALVAKSTLHPALVGLLIDAAREVHADAGLFNRMGEFPKPLDPEFSLAEDTERYYRSGPSFLKRNLPFWLAIFIERTSLVLVPLAGVLLPLMKAGPLIYRWRNRRRLLHWYGRLKALELSIASDPARANLYDYKVELAWIEQSVATVPIPIGFADEYYELRAAIELVRQQLNSRTGGVDTPPDWRDGPPQKSEAAVSP